MLNSTLSELEKAVRPTAPVATPHKTAEAAAAESAEAAQQSAVERHERRRLLARIAAVAVVIAFTAVTIAVCRSLPNPHLKIELHNDSGGEVKEIRFAFAGGSGVRACQAVPAGGVVSWDVNGESQGFSVDYRDGNGRAINRKCDVYFDGDQWGTLFVHIKPGGLKVLTEVDARP